MEIAFACSRDLLGANEVPGMSSKVISILPQVPPDTQSIGKVLRDDSRREALECDGTRVLDVLQHTEEPLKIDRSCPQVATVRLPDVDIPTGELRYITTRSRDKLC